MKKKLLLIVFIFCYSINWAQEGGTEISVLDAFVTPEKPHVLKLSFFTNEPVKSVFILNNKYEFTVTKDFSEDHAIEILMKGYTFDSTTVPYIIKVTNKNGDVTTSEIYDIALPADNELLKGESPNFFTLCLGGIIFGMPSPTYSIFKDGKYFSLSKEITLFTFFGDGFNYPVALISAEYAHIIDGPKKNFLRIGYKQIISTKYIEYISPGVNGFTDFLGFNGISPEISVGWFTLYNVFTVYSKYRFNTNFNEGNLNFHEVSIGLYSSFFSINF